MMAFPCEPTTGRIAGWKVTKLVAQARSKAGYQAGLIQKNMVVIRVTHE